MEDRPKGYLPSQLWIPPVIYLILMFTLQWCGLRDKEMGDERMRDRERPGWWWLSVDGPRSTGRVVAGWTRLAGSRSMPDKPHRSHWHISESEHWLKRTLQDATQSESQTHSTQSSRQSHLNDSNMFFFSLPNRKRANSLHSVFAKVSVPLECFHTLWHSDHKP